MTEREAFNLISGHLSEIEADLGGKYTLTIVARYNRNDLSDADMIVSGEKNLDEAVGVIGKLHSKQPTFDERTDAGGAK